MRKAVMMGAALALCVAVGGAADAADKGAKKGKLTVTSAEVKEGKQIANEQVYKGFGCNGDNISPAVSWSKGPAGTKSYALTVYDPDAPTGSGFWHWVVYNIPADVTSIPKGAGDASKNLMPAGAVQSRTDFGVPGWGGPCPPAGDKPHHYQFRVFAVDTDKLAFGPNAAPDANTSAAVIGFLLHFHTLAEGKLTGVYSRAK